MNEAKSHRVEFYSKVNWKLKKQHRWRIIANNGKIIGASSEGYYNKADCEANAQSVSKSISDFFA
jgi:uncharacterized protein YegP (UPF0339 family)